MIGYTSFVWPRQLERAPMSTIGLATTVPVARSRAGPSTQNRTTRARDTEPRGPASGIFGAQPESTAAAARAN